MQNVLFCIPVASEPEVEDTGKDFLVMKEDEVHCCLWSAWRVEPKKLWAHGAVQSRLKTLVCVYSWNKLQELQVQDPDISLVLTAIKVHKKPKKQELCLMS